VEINISYYDAKLATDIALFAKSCASLLSYLVDQYDHYGTPSARTQEQMRYHDITCKIWFQTTGVDIESKLGDSERLRFLKEAHTEYRRRWEDQEKQKRDGTHLKRICASLARFPKLDSIVMDDAPHQRKKLRQYKPTTRMRVISDDDGDTEENSNFQGQYLMSMFLVASRWKGTSTTAFVTEPPVEIIPELFQALMDHSIRSKSFSVNFSPPNNLRCLQLTETQQKAIRSVVDPALSLKLHIPSWDRKRSSAEDNSRPHDEMLALCSFATAFPTQIL